MWEGGKEIQMDARRGPTAATLLSVLHTMDTCYLHMHSDQICRTCTKLGTCPSPNFEERLPTAGGPTCFRLASSISEGA
jgi:hypothetical protein